MTATSNPAVPARGRVPDADPALKPAVVTDEDRFQFDLQGYLLLRGAMSDTDRREILTEVHRLEGLEHDDTRWRVPHANGKTGEPSKQATPGFIRLNGLFRMTTHLDRLIDYPTVFPYLREFVDDPQIGNAWSITKSAGWDGGGWHRGVEPDQYTVRHGRIRSRMLNVIYFLTENTLDNGCMLVIPGGHKSNFDLPWSNYKKLALPGSVALTAEPGDVLLMSEALLHTGLGSTSPRKRTNLYFNYVSRNFSGLTYTPEQNFHFAMPPHVRARFTPARKQASLWMEHAVTID